MRRIFAVGAVLGLLVTGGGAAQAAIKQAPVTESHVAGKPSAGKPSAAEVGRIKAALTKMPLRFLENRGQVRGDVNYYLRGSGTSVAFTPTGLTYAMTAPSKVAGAAMPGAKGTTARENEKRERWGLKLDFVGAKATKPVAEAVASGRVNHFKGSPKEWRTGLKAYQRLVYNDLWPGIDLVYSGTGRELKYEFRVAPGADPSRIRMAWRGPSDVSVDKSGALQVKTGVGSFADKAPVTYQPGADGGRRADVKSAFRLTKTKDAFTYGVDLGSYDRSRPLVIDPATLVYAGYIGGTASDSGADIAVDSSGAAYIAGATDSSDFPATVGDLGDTFNGVTDAFVAKVTPDGSSLAYAGYIGGSNNDAATGVAVDSDGAAYVTGYAVSTPAEGFPVLVGPDLTPNGSTDAFVAKVAVDGSGLDYAGYIGGAGGDAGDGIAVDVNGAAYVGGYTNSDESSFPVTVGPDVTQNGDYDAFVARVAVDGSSLDYAGYVGGAGRDLGYDIAVDSSGAAYLSGETQSTAGTFPVTAGSLDVTHNGLTDGFVAKVTSDGSGLDYAGYIGGSADDIGNSIALDSDGAAYVAGQTESDQATFPVTAGSFDDTHNGVNDGFVAKVKPDGSGLDYAGYIGGASTDFAQGVAVDSAGAVYVSGFTASAENSFPVTVGPDLTYNGNSDAFVAKLRLDGTGLAYAGYIGGGDLDTGLSVAVDSDGAAYVTGHTESGQATFPETVGSLDETFNGVRDAFVAKVSALEADLGVTKSDTGFDPVTVGQNVTYTLEVTNNGPDTADGVTLTDTLPAQLDFDSATGGCVETSAGSNVVTCPIGVLASGGSTMRTITATAVSTGTANNTVTVTSATSDPTPGNNTANESTTVNPAPVAQCFGMPATITGTAGNDRINGTNGDDVIIAGNGNDTVNGRGGNDRICGGPGTDALSGGQGSDQIDGGINNDSLSGGGDNDTLLGGDGGDALTGGPGNDSLDGGPGTNANNGGPGTDTCTNPTTGRGCEL